MFVRTITGKLAEDLARMLVKTHTARMLVKTHTGGFSRHGIVGSCRRRSDGGQEGIETASARTGSRPASATARPELGVGGREGGGGANRLEDRTNCNGSEGLM